MVWKERYLRRFPQPARVGDLIGMPVLDLNSKTLGYVRQIVRSSAGEIQFIIGYSPWWGSFGRLVAVPLEAIVRFARDGRLEKRTWLRTNYFHVLAPRQRNGSSREANPSSNEDDATGWSRHGKEAMSGESAEGDIAGDLRPREYLTEKEIERLQEAARKRSRYGHRDARRLHRAAQVSQVFWVAGACSTRQRQEALGLCRACRHRLRPGNAEVALWHDAAATHRQEAFRPKSEGRERDHLAYSQARRRGKIQ